MMSEKVPAVIAYLFWLPGLLIAVLLGRKSRFCRHHIRRSLELLFFLLCLFCAWFVVLYLLILIPYAGFPIAISLFGIVVTGTIFCMVLCIRGIIKALKGERVVFPLVSSFPARIGPLRKLLDKIDPIELKQA
jgi:uncharacterized membrane protein